MRAAPGTRLRASRLALALLALAAAALAQPARSAAAEPHVAAVESVGFTVSDLGRAVAFFTEVLGFEKAAETELAGPEIERLQGVFAARVRIARLRLGDETIELTEYLAPRGRPIPEGSRSQDRWFQHVAIVVSDMERAYARLREHRVAHVSPEPQRLPDWNPNAGGIEAFYFQDPDGHVLELIAFPPGKGDPRWQRADVRAGRLFLGIDHTAIVVGDTERSLAFWQGQLGLRVAGGSENHGPEQERLNAVFGARLRITTLRAPAGPGVELLEYLSPRDGRPRPADARANDLLHWQTGVTTPSLSSLETPPRAARIPFLSPSAAVLGDAALGIARARLAADPDGHVVRLAEPSARLHAAKEMR